jgi:hypothetical protein
MARSAQEKSDRVDAIMAKVTGGEPRYELFNEENRGKFMTALNWYNYEKDKKDALAYAGLWIKKNWPAEHRLWAKIDARAFTQTFGWIARMKSNGTVFDTDTDRRFEQHLREVLRTAQSVQEPEPQTVAAVPGRSIQDAIAEKQAEFIGHIEGELDDFMLAGFASDFNLYKYCQGNNVAKQYMKPLSDVMQIKIDELALIGSDAQVTEGYAHLGKRQVKKLVDWLTEIQTQAASYANFKKANRKPRVKKAKPASEQVSKIKYLKQHEDLKSVAAASIIGAAQLWVYNIKNKKLGVYNATGPAGFSVKGTSLQGYDPDTSVQRTLRKPDVVIPKMMAAGKIALRKILPDLTTTETALNGRFNEDTLLLRVL